jgi:hypothetical protein
LAQSFDVSVLFEIALGYSSSNLFGKEISVIMYARSMPSECLVGYREELGVRMRV